MMAIEENSYRLIVYEGTNHRILRLEDTIKKGYPISLILLNENGSPNNVCYMHIYMVSLGLFPPHSPQDFLSHKNIRY